MLVFIIILILENPYQSYIQGSNVSAEWVLLNTVYEKHTRTDLNGLTFNELHFMQVLGPQIDQPFDFFIFKI